MRRFLSLLCLFALCLSLCACGLFHAHTYTDSAVLSEPSAGMDGKKEQVCSVCHKTQTVDYPAASLVCGSTFSLTIEEFTQRISAIGTRLCPGLTVHLNADPWSAVTELRYNGATFCQITYYDNDDYLDNPYPDQPMNAAMLDTLGIRHVNVLDFPDVPHAPNSFAAIAMTFDPLITEAEALELADFLAGTRQDYYGNYLVTAVNGVGYGHAYPVNQLEYSGSIAIHAGSEMPQLCVHDPEYEFSGDGVPSGYCRKCGAYVSPAGDNWRYLTGMEVVGHSDNSSRSADIAIGNWEDPVGAVYWSAMKFWVIDRSGWSNTEYIEYALDGTYSTLSGTIVSSVDSDPNAVMWIEIYLDDRLAYTSSKVGYFDYVPYMVDIRGAKNIRISCSTDTNAQGYCVATAAVY